MKIIATLLHHRNSHQLLCSDMWTNIKWYSKAAQPLLPWENRKHIFSFDLLLTQYNLDLIPPDISDKPGFSAQILLLKFVFLKELSFTTPIVYLPYTQAYTRLSPIHT